MIASIDIGLGPAPRILAISEFVDAPGPGVVLVDLNGQEMLYSATVWMDAAGHVTEGGSGQSSTGWALWDGCVSVTGRAHASVKAVRVDVSSTEPAASFSFDVTPGPDGWYAGCRPLPNSWPGLEGVSVLVRDLA